MRHSIVNLCRTSYKDSLKTLKTFCMIITLLCSSNRSDIHSLRAKMPDALVICVVAGRPEIADLAKQNLFSQKAKSFFLQATSNGTHLSHALVICTKQYASVRFLLKPPPFLSTYPLLDSEVTCQAQFSFLVCSLPFHPIALVFSLRIKPLVRPSPSNIPSLSSSTSAAPQPHNANTPPAI